MTGSAEPCLIQLGSEEGPCREADQKTGSVSAKEGLELKGAEQHLDRDACWGGSSGKVLSGRLTLTRVIIYVSSHLIKQEGFKKKKVNVFMNHFKM